MGWGRHLLTAEEPSVAWYEMVPPGEIQIMSYLQLKNQKEKSLILTHKSTCHEQQITYTKHHKAKDLINL